MDENTFKVQIGSSIVEAFSDICGDKLSPGDLYIAQRNTGWCLGKCLRVEHEMNYVMPDPPCSIYSYDLHECRKVKSIVEV